MEYPFAIGDRDEVEACPFSLRWWLFCIAIFSLSSLRCFLFLLAFLSLFPLNSSLEASALSPDLLLKLLMVTYKAHPTDKVQIFARKPSWIFHSRLLTNWNCTSLSAEFNSTLLSLYPQKFWENAKNKQKLSKNSQTLVILYYSRLALSKATQQSTELARETRRPVSTPLCAALILLLTGQIVPIGLVKLLLMWYIVSMWGFLYNKKMLQSAKSILGGFRAWQQKQGRHEIMYWYF